MGTDADLYPVRYFSPGGDISLDVPVEWAFNQKTDSGYEVDSISETYAGEPVAAIYSIEKSRKAETAQQAMETFLELEWMSARRVESAEQTDFAASSGASGWRLIGTMAGGSDEAIREGCMLFAFPDDELVFVLAAYPDRSAAPDSFQTGIETMAKSLRWEERRTRDVDKVNALQLAAKEPSTLDPAKTMDGAGEMIGDIYSGLVALDASLAVQPGLAERWDVTPDGMTYTFHLRQNAQFHNGRPVTADDVFFSWLRAASPDLNSNTAVRYLGDIDGLKEYREGKTGTISGIHIVDPHTIQVTLDAAKPVFLQKLTYPASWIVDRYSVRLPHWELHPNGTGPFRVVQRVLKKSLILEANPEYYDLAPRLQYLIYWISSTPQETLYKSGKIDRMEISNSLLPNVNDPHDPLFGSVSVDPKLCTNFILFNTAIPPFDDPAVRKAFELSVDRAVYVEVTTEEGDIPGAGLLPPGMPGYSSSQARDLYDPQEAKRLFSSSMYFGGAGSAPDIRFTVPSEAGEYDSTMEFLIDSWERVLGIEIFVEGLSYAEYRERSQEKPSEQMIFSHHCADYPDPENFYDFLFHGDNAGIYYGYGNDSLDALLDSASVETNWNRRLDLYHQADRILYDDAPAMILSYTGPQYVVWKVHVMGYISTPIEIPQNHLIWIQRD